MLTELALPGEWSSQFTELLQQDTDVPSLPRGATHACVWPTGYLSPAQIEAALEHPGFERAGSFNSRDRVHRAHLDYRVFLQLKTPLHKVLGGVLSLRI